MSLTSSRVLQYIAILSTLLLFGGAYWYFSVRGATRINSSQNSAVSSGLAGQWSFDGADITGAISGTVNYLVVAGGGGGGANGGGGGGAGGMLTGTIDVIAQSYAVTVGDGGAVAVNGGSRGTSGGNSSFSTITATGGGGGASRDGGAALSGGSGGGGGGAVGGSGSATKGSASPAGQGNDGGNGTAEDEGCNAAGGGGGGAGSAGSAAAVGVGGNGGTGLVSSISGSSVTYAGGGGGGRTCTDSTRGSGGSGGGGNGGGSVTAGTSGTANTGGGSGGVLSLGIGSITGGSGIVIISYTTGSFIATGGTITTSGGNTIHTFTSSGTFAVSTTANDTSGNGKNGTVTGTTRTIGKIGQALDFGGTSDYLSVGNVGSVNSVSFWIKADNTTKKILDLNGTAYVEVSSGTITATGFTSPAIYVDGAVASTIDTNWHHVVITTASTITASAVDIGRVSTGYFDGKLDDVRMYSRVITAGEVGQLYALGTPATVNASQNSAVASGLVGQWSFDGGQVSGATVTDGSGQGNTGVTHNPWTSRTSAADNSWHSVTYGNGLFVAVAFTGTGNRVMTSPDGITWTIRTSAADNDWRSVTYGNGLFVAVADTGTGNRVMTSPDGITWTIRTSAADNAWRSVTYGNGLFVAVAYTGTGNRVMTSPDGITWTIRTSAAGNFWLSVTYGNGLFVAVAYTGTGNRVMTSPDGITWTIRTSAADNQWYSVTYGNGLFVAVADTGTGNRVMTSPDGITWTIRTSAADNFWHSVTYGNGLFVAVAYTGTGNRVMTSPDGITWTIRTSAADNAWRSVTYGNGLFVAVASSGTGNRVMTTGHPTVLTGRIGQALNFTSENGDYVSVGSIGNVNSVSFWINTASTTQKIIDLNGSAYVEVSAGTITATGFTSPTIYVDGSVASTIDTGWHHVVITTASTITASAVNIGKVSTGYFDGKLDDVRMYSRAVTAGEVTQLYSLGTPATVNASQNGAVASGLVGQWSFDGADISGVTVYDRSGNNKNGTATGTSAVIGKIGQALDFNGTSDYLSVGNVGSVNSVSFWIKADNTTKKIIDLNGTAYVEVSSGTITATGWTSPTIYVDGAVASTIDTNWHHVVITTASTITASAVNIGKVSTGYFDGKLDDVRMYSRVLSAGEAQTLYRSGS